ncbi:MAG: hypothetical protein H6996_02290 [Moraxellaceae bacterium]|nr:hypothetical protein [Moraxellaceae bacterium]MCP5177658.1 hypothetical protein [Moraxellaceae bacterium]
MSKSSLSAVSVVALITLTLVQSFGLSAHISHLSFVPVWLLFMLIANLPLVFVDAVIVRRSKQLPLEGIAPITREADIATIWRVLVPLAMLGLTLIMGQASYHVSHNVSWTEASPLLKEALPYLVMFFSVGFAWVGTRRLLPYIGILVPVALVVNAIGTPFNLQFNLLTPEEWRLGAGVALLSACSASGVYAWLLMQQAPQTSASTQVLPLWLTQTVVGVLALVIGQTQGQTYLVMYLLCAIFALSACAESLGAQLQAKGWKKPIALGGVLLASAITVSAAPYVVFDVVLKAVVWLSLLGFAVLTGWMLKISHVRKALNFSSEASYNLWRVSIRIVVPITIVWLMVGMFL